jgi:hypothetical protein
MSATTVPLGGMGCATSSVFQVILPRSVRRCVLRVNLANTTTGGLGNVEMQLVGVKATELGCAIVSLVYGERR